MIDASPVLYQYLILPFLNYFNILDAGYQTTNHYKVIMKMRKIKNPTHKNIIQIQGFITWPIMDMFMLESKEYCMHIGPGLVQSRTPSHCCLIRIIWSNTSNSVLLGLWWAPSLGLFSIGNPLPSPKSLARCRKQAFALDLYKV